MPFVFSEPAVAPPLPRPPPPAGVFGLGVRYGGGPPPPVNPAEPPPEAPSVESLQGAIPHVKVRRYVGCGGMGFVYEAHQSGANRTVALKILRRDRGFGPEEEERLLREGQILASLNDRGIVSCHDVGVTADQRPYILMEWVDGKTLAEALEAHQQAGENAFSLEEAIEIIIPAARAMRAAHDKGCFHRDLKPGNIMLTYADAGTTPKLPPISACQVKVLDFGLAVRRLPDGGAAPLTSPGGSEGYEAPEQKEPGGKVSERTDVYGLAARVYHRPWRGWTARWTHSCARRWTPCPNSGTLR